MWLVLAKQQPAPSPDPVHSPQTSKIMDIPPSRKRELLEKEIAFIKDAVHSSGLDPALINLKWAPQSVVFDHVVELQPVLFDCRGLLDTACWLLRRFAPAGDGSDACMCGSLVRGTADGTYSSLKAAMAAALAEVLRSRLLATLPDSAEPIHKRSQADRPETPPNDFITQCVHT